MRQARQRPRSATPFRVAYVGRGRVVVWRVLDRQGREAGGGEAETLDQAKTAASNHIAELKAGQTAKE